MVSAANTLTFSEIHLKLRQVTRHRRGSQRRDARRLQHPRNPGPSARGAHSLSALRVLRQFGAHSSKYARSVSYRDASFVSPAPRKQRQWARTFSCARENWSRMPGTSLDCSSSVRPRPSTTVLPSISRLSIDRQRSALLPASLAFVSEMLSLRVTASKNSTHFGPTTMRGSLATLDSRR